MKSFFKKRWHGIPVAVMTAVMLVVLVAGSAFAVTGYSFLKADLVVDVEEAIAVGTFDSWDNLHPYGSDEAAVWEEVGGEYSGDDHDGIGVLGDLLITINDPDLGESHVITITHIGSGKYVGSGFAAGEWIVIPLNIRNGSSGALTLGATAEAGDLALDCIYEENSGVPTAETFMPTESWFPLADFNETIDGYGGKSGSAVVGANVLFVKITAPGDAVPATYTDVTFTITRQ